MNEEDDAFDDLPPSTDRTNHPAEIHFPVSQQKGSQNEATSAHSIKK